MDKEKTYTLTRSDLETFARMHRAFCLQHNNGGRVDQIRDEHGTVNLHEIRTQAGNLLARFGISPDDQVIHSPAKGG